MACELIKLNRLTKEQSSIQINMDIRSFCCVDDDIYFIHSEGIGIIQDGIVNPNWYQELCSVDKPDLSSLSSIAYCQFNNSLYVVSDGGSQIGKVDLIMLDFEFMISKGSVRQFKEKFLSVDDSDTYIVSDGRKIIWSVKDCHRCFQMLDSKAVPLVGCGKSGYSMSKLEHARISCPTGVAIMNGVICFSDMGNNCLRGVSNNKLLTIISECKNVKDVFYHDEKIFFLSDKIIYMLSSEGDSGHLFEIYRSNNLMQSFFPKGNDCMYLLYNNYDIPLQEENTNQST
jgi:hypothetical protein